MKMEFNATKMVEEIVMKAKENQEEFIIETIRPYCENILQMKINKEELKQILLNGMQKQQPCEDCVSRQAVLNLFNKSDDYRWETTWIRRKIEKLPSVTPKAKTGHWIKYGIPRCGEQHYKCTSCGYYINFGQWGELYTKEFKCCPNCGADMRESEDKE